MMTKPCPTIGKNVVATTLSATTDADAPDLVVNIYFLENKKMSQRFNFYIHILALQNGREKMEITPKILHYFG